MKEENYCVVAMRRRTKRNNVVNKKKGFTLIELLVVVLIIGILAAIALPQYRKAVFNSRMKEIEVAMKALDTAYIEYQLIHGTNSAPANLDDVTIGLPDSCVNLNTSGDGWLFRYRCKNFSVGVTSSVATRSMTATTEFQPQVYFDMRKGQFSCRTSSMNSNPIYKNYCDRMGYPATP
jgi:prepilin-type N-terminal cleavage/methylation domain-containing protein